MEKNYYVKGIKIPIRAGLLGDGTDIREAKKDGMNRPLHVFYPSTQTSSKYTTEKKPHYMQNHQTE